MQCATCGSYAINHHLHGRDGSDGDKCDVCYWRSRAERYAAVPELLKAASAALHYMRLHKYADQTWADDLEAAIASVVSSNIEK